MGAAPRRPALPGVEQPHVLTVAEVLSGAAEVRGRCVVLDETGYTPGPKVADALSGAGFQVEIVTRQYSLGEDIGTTLRARLLERLLRQGVVITPLARPVAIREGAVQLQHELTGALWECAADTVVLASGGAARDAMYNEAVAATAGAAAPRLFLIGDAYAPRNLRLSMVDGARVGREL